jgi:hypothetical protein
MRRHEVSRLSCTILMFVGNLVFGLGSTEDRDDPFDVLVRIAALFPGVTLLNVTAWHSPDYLASLDKAFHRYSEEVELANAHALESYRVWRVRGFAFLYLADSHVPYFKTIKIYVPFFQIWSDAQDLVAHLWYPNRTHPPRIEIELDASAYASCSLQAKRRRSFARTYIESKMQEWGVLVVFPDCWDWPRRSSWI